MFHHQGRKTKPMHTKSLHDLIALVTPEGVLAEARRPGLLQKITQSCAMPASQFNGLCLKLVHNFINHCQRLPETANSYYALPGGLLDHALNRTEAALHLFRHTLVHDDDDDLSEEQHLWLYALFSASILQGIGKLQLDYKIDQFDANGQLLTRWNPLCDKLTAVGTYYHYEFLQGSEDDLRRRLNLLLARQLMPESGFAWIAGNSTVLAAWLALLHDDPNAAGILGAILERADGIAIQRDLNEFLIRHNGSSGARPSKISTFIDATPETNPEKDRLLGAEFIKWLTQEIKKGEFNINKVPLMLIQTGLVMSREVYQLFMRNHPEVRYWQAIEKGLLSWGLHRHDAGQHAATGTLILDKYAVVLPDEVQVHNPATGKKITVSAVNLVYSQQTPGNMTPMQHLSRSGKWLAIEASATTLQSGFSRRE